MRKIIALLLCAVLLAACALPGFAQEPKKLVLLGDSIARGAGVWNSDEACYGRIVANTNGYSYKNYGVDGTRSWDLLARMERDEVKKDIAEADIINISIGGNDYLQQNLLVLIPEVLLGIDENMDNIEKDFAKYFAEIIAVVRGLNPDVTLIVNTLYNPQWGLVGYIYGQAVLRVNRVINAYYEAHPADFVRMDVSEVMEHPECVAADTIHPSAVGNEEIAKVLLQTLCELGYEGSTIPVIAAKGVDEIPYVSYVMRFLRFIFTPSARVA